MTRERALRGLGTAGRIGSVFGSTDFEVGVSGRNEASEGNEFLEETEPSELDRPGRSTAARKAASHAARRAEWGRGGLAVKLRGADGPAGLQAHGRQEDRGDPGSASSPTSPLRAYMDAGALTGERHGCRRRAAWRPSRDAAGSGRWFGLKEPPHVGEGRQEGGQAVAQGGQRHRSGGWTPSRRRQSAVGRMPAAPRSSGGFALRESGDGA